MKARAAAIVLLGLIVLAAHVFFLPPVEAQQAGKVYKVGVLDQGQNTPEQRARGPFRNALRDLGWVEGLNFTLEHRQSVSAEPLDGLAAELVRLRVDVILANGTPATRASIRATSIIPIVMIVGIDPVARGLVTSLSRPGGNVTGLTSIRSELTGKTLELIKEMVPGVRRLGFIYDPSSYDPSSQAGTEFAKVVTTMGMRLQSLPVRSPDDFDSAFAAMTRERADALWVSPSGMTLLHRTRLAELAAKHRIPAMYGFRENVQAGGLMVYSADWTALLQRSAIYVDKILKGAKPGDLPVEQPTKFELVINLKTAKALGLTIPPSLLLRADQVME